MIHDVYIEYEEIHIIIGNFGKIFLTITLLSL